MFLKNSWKDLVIQLSFLDLAGVIPKLPPQFAEFPWVDYFERLSFLS